MKKEYELQGMSCGGCVSSVKNALLKLPGIEEAEIHLYPQTAVLIMREVIDVAELQARLSKAGHYTIKEVAYNQSATKNMYKNKSVLSN